MKPQMMSRAAMSQLFDHILDGFKTSHEGILNLKEQGLVSDEEIAELVKKNSERLIDRIREFKILQRLVCVVFALMFGYMQIGCQDIDMLRSGRARGRRRNETENVITL